MDIVKELQLEDWVSPSIKRKIKEEYDYEHRTPLYKRGADARLKKNPASSWFVYCISLRPFNLPEYKEVTRDNCFYYVGYTTDVVRRFREHCGQERYDGSTRKNEFIKYNKPIKPIFKRCFGDDEEAALAYENELTLKLMAKYGYEKVRGGKYTRYPHSAEDIEEITKLIN